MIDLSVRGLVKGFEQGNDIPLRTINTLQRIDRFVFLFVEKLRLSFARFWENRLNSPSLNRMNVIPAAGSERPPLPEKNASLQEVFFATV